MHITSRDPQVTRAKVGIAIAIAAVSAMFFIEVALPHARKVNAQNEASVDDIREVQTQLANTPWRACGLTPSHDLAVMRKSGLVISNGDLDMLKRDVSDCKERIQSKTEHYRGVARQSQAFAASGQSH